MTVSGAQDYYNNVIIKKFSLPGSTTNINSIGLKKTNQKFVFFKKAFASQNDTAFFVEVPVAYNQRHSSTIGAKDSPQKSSPGITQQLNSSLSRLIISKNKKTGIISQYIITYLPDPEYLSKFGNDISKIRLDKIDEHFTGYISYRSYDEKLIYIAKIKYGIQVRKFYPESALKPGKSVNAVKTNQLVCPDIYENIYEHTCYYSDPEHTQEEYCTEWVLIDQINLGPGPCYDDGTGGDGGGGGGGGGIGNPSYNMNRVITSQQAPQCLKDIIAKILAQSSYNNVMDLLTQQYEGQSLNPFHDISGIISSIANSGTWNINISAGTLPSQTDYAGNTFTPNATTSPVNGQLSITLDLNYLSGASDLAVARTVIHEFLHSYFEFGYSSAAGDPDAYAQFQLMNNYLFKRNGQPDDTEDNQHEQIAQRYVDQLANLLEQYGRSIGTTSPDPDVSFHQYCVDMAWGGLTGTSAYRHYAQNKSRVERELQNEQTKNSQSTPKAACSTQ